MRRLALATLLLPSLAHAQFGPSRDNDLTAAEDSGDIDAPSRPTDRRPGALDPYDHAALFEFGLGKVSASTALGSAQATYLPMRVRVDAVASDHLLIRARFGIPGVVADSTGVGSTGNQRIFRPGNLTLGGYYLFGSRGRVTERRHRFEYTVGVGGTFTAPTFQFDGDDPGGTALAAIGAFAVHGQEGFIDFEPEAGAVTPGAFARVAYGPVFASASADLTLAFSTDSHDASHGVSLRVEAGWRGGDMLRLGVGMTEVARFGGDLDAGQAAFRAFLRLDLRAVTLGTEFALNLDSPFGWAFDDGKTWGLITAAGISL